MPTVIGPVGTRTFRVLWCLEELGLDYEHQVERPHSDAVNALNPLKQVPILKDGGATITDSLAILHYLTDRDGRLTYPAGSLERARLDGRINFLITELEAPLWLSTRHSYVLPEARRNPNARQIATDDFRDASAKFAGLLGGNDYFVGEDFSIADIIAGHCIGWALVAKFELSAELNAYYERLRARPAWSRARRE